MEAVIWQYPGVETGCLRNTGGADEKCCLACEILMAGLKSIFSGLKSTERINISCNIGESFFV
jgi:hypothetical protein